MRSWIVFLKAVFSNPVFSKPALLKPALLKPALLKPALSKTVLVQILAFLGLTGALLCWLPEQVLESREGPLYVLWACALGAGVACAGKSLWTRASGSRRAVAIAALLASAIVVGCVALLGPKLVEAGAWMGAARAVDSGDLGTWAVGSKLLLRWAIFCVAAAALAGLWWVVVSALASAGCVSGVSARADKKGRGGG